MWTVVSITGLLLLVSILIYLPPVQNFIKDKAAQAVSESLGMDLSIGKIRLRFPLRLTLENTTLITAQGDTLARAGSISAGVALAPLVTGEISVARLKLKDVGANYRDTVSMMHLHGTLGSLTVENTGVRMSGQSVRIGNITLSRADITLDLGEAPPDTTAADTTSMAWKLRLRSLDLDDVSFRMRTSPEVTELTATIAKGSLRRLAVDLGTQEIDAGTLSIDNGSYVYFTDTTTVAPAAEALPEEEEESLPWTVRLARLELNDNSARYGALYGEPAEGFDPAHIEADAINLRIDSVFNRGAEISAAIVSLALRERSGLEITEGRGRFSMTPQAITLEDFGLRTPSSDIQARLDADASVLDMDEAAKISATLSANISVSDAFLLYRPDPAMRKALAGKSFVLDSELSGTLGDISLRTLKAQMPGHIALQASGNIRSATKPGNIAGNLRLSSSFRNLDFVKGMLPESIRNTVGFPRAMTLSGTVSATGSSYTPNLVVMADSGRVAINGSLDTRAETYKAELTADNFPLGTFLPHDSLGLATLRLTAAGKGFNPVSNNASADITASIGRFDYNRYNFSGITLDATLKEHILSGNIASDSKALQLNLALGGELRDSLYAASLRGTVGKADIHAMGFMADPMSLSFTLEAEASAQMADSAYKASIALDSVAITHGTRTEKFGLTTLKASANRSSVTAGLASGDLRMDFTSSESITSLVNGMTAAAEILVRQIDSLNIDILPIQQAMPAFKLDFSAKRKNPLRDYFYSTGMDFSKITLSAGNGPGTPIAAGVVVNGLRTGGLTLDTLNVWVGQRKEKLSYGVRVRNRPGNIDQMAFIAAGGTVAGNTATVNMIQRDRSDNTGFRFGITAELLDSAVRASMTPLNSIFGYQEWTANEGNYFTYHFDKRMEADLRLEGKNGKQFFRITSLARDDMPHGSVKLDMSGMDIGSALRLFPAAPPLEGILAGNGSIGLSENIFKGDLSFALNNLKYDGQKVGNISFGAIANINENKQWSLDLLLGANSKTAMTVRGTYDIWDTGALDIKVAIPGLDLGLVGAFLPVDMARLSGTANGNLDLTGTIEKPVMNGGLAFTNSRLAIPMIGTTYKISNDKITISNSRVNFNGFGLIAPNNRKLALDGSVDVSDFSAIRTNLNLSASNFEAVNSPRSSGSQVYGVVAFDINVRLRGLLDALSVRGNINLLSRTNVYYSMRDSPLEVKEAKQDIVSFVSFANEEDWALADSVPLRRPSSIDMLVNVDMQDNVRATVNLMENGSSRIELAGDGALAYIMNSQGDTRLTGRYNLSGGKVVYAVPVVGAKEFSIDDGSYVEWIGEMANPSFRITATEATSIKITDANGVSRTVNFDIVINVRNTLENMELTFDLRAPRDGDIHSELQSLSAEERSQKALYMLITNTYQSDAFVSEGSGFDVNQQIGDFISNELSRWARNNLKGVELSVGMDTVDDQGATHTDYSYSVSKSLFDDRFKISIGGTVSNDKNINSTEENFVDDVEIEYRITKRDNIFIKGYRYNTQESILEGEVVETGVGLVIRKKMNKLRELFRLVPDPAIRLERQKARELQREIRLKEQEQGIDPAKEQNQDVPMPAGDGNTASGTPSGTPVATTAGKEANIPEDKGNQGPKR